MTEQGPQRPDYGGRENRPSPESAELERQMLRAARGGKPLRVADSDYVSLCGDWGSFTSWLNPGAPRKMHPKTEIGWVRNIPPIVPSWNDNVAIRVITTMYRELPPMPPVDPYYPSDLPRTRKGDVRLSIARKDLEGPITLDDYVQPRITLGDDGQVYGPVIGTLDPDLFEACRVFGLDVRMEVDLWRRGVDLTPRPMAPAAIRRFTARYKELLDIAEKQQAQASEGNDQSHPSELRKSGPPQVRTSVEDPREVGRSHDVFDAADDGVELGDPDVPLADRGNDRDTPPPQQNRKRQRK